MRRGAFGAVGAAAIVAVFAVQFGWDNSIRGDATSFLGVAKDLTGEGLGPGDWAYRYGRIFYPALASAFALGHDPWLPGSLAAINVLCFGASIALGTELAARHGARASRGLLVLLAPALWFGLVISWSESLVVALLLGSVLAAEHKQHRLAAGLLALAALTKESAILVAIPMVVIALRRRQWKTAAVYASSALPLMMWWTWTRLRLGEFPFLASTSSRSGAVGPPGLGIGTLLLQAVTPMRIAVAVLVVATAMAACRQWVRHPNCPLAGAAGILGLFSLCFGAHVLVHPMDTLRVMSPALALLALSAAVEVRSPGADRESTMTAPEREFPSTWSWRGSIIHASL